MSHEWAKLLGEKVLALFVWNDELYFACESGVLHAGMSADCCSDSWVADVVNIEGLLGGTVSCVEPVTLNDANLPARVWDDSRTHQEEEQYFGFVIRTERGTCSIVARNSSNGYYGGSFEGLDEAKLPALARKLTEDYSA